MKKLKKGLAFFLALAMMFCLCQATVFADPAPTESGHLSAEVTEDDSVQVGDEFTIKLSLSEMEVASFAGGLHFDSDYVECINVNKGSYLMTENGGSGFNVLQIALGTEKRDVGMYLVGTQNMKYNAADDFVTVTFKALKAGTAKFNLYEDAADENKNVIFKSDAYGEFSVDISSGAVVSGTAFSLVDADGETIDVSVDEMKAAESVTTTVDAPWTYNETNKAVGTFYSLKSILESKGVDASEAHGLKVVATDGFTSGFTAEEIENLYIYDMSEVTINGEKAGAAGTYGTALNGGKGNKWAKSIASVAIATDHVWFVKGGTCKHYCSICNADEPSITLAAADGTEVTVYDCDIKAAQSVTITADAPWTYKNGEKTAVGTFYSLKSILENKEVDVSSAHGLKVVATDGFTSGFAAEDIENLYIYEMSEVTINGAPAGAAGTYGTAINGSAGNKWASDIASVSIAADHVWFVKGGTCKHFCAICNADEPSITLEADGEEVTVYDCEIKAASSVTTTAEEPWTYKNGANVAVGTFYSLKSILESKGIDASEAHGLKVVATDGFTSGFAAEDIENLYIYEMSEVTINGEAAGAAGTYGTALNGAAGNKWASDIASVSIAADHVWFVKSGTCKHFCAICDADEPSITLEAADGTEVTVYDCEMRAAASVTTTADAPWTYNETNKAVGTFYSLKSILESKGVDASEAHGLKVVATDGFTSGFTAEEIENLYIYDMSEVTINGETVGTAGTYGTALNGGAGNKWAKSIATVAIATDHVWFVKNGACKHFCSICGEGEELVVVWDTTTTPYSATVKYADCGTPAGIEVEISSEITKEPTCTAEGEITYTASYTVDNQKYTDTKTATVAKIEHTTKVQGIKIATCTEDGYTGDTVCTVCKEIFKKGEVIPALGHSHKSTIKPATCTTAGEKTYTCACGDTYTEVLPAIGHIYSNGTCTVCGAADPNYKPDTNVTPVVKQETEKAASEVKNDIVDSVTSAIKEVKAAAAASGETLSTDKLVETVKQAMKDSEDETVAAVVDSVSDETLEKVIVAIEENKEISVTVVAQVVSEEEIIEKAKEDVNKILLFAGDEGIVAQYLELSVLIQAEDADGNVETLGTVDNPTQAFTFTLSVPENLQKDGRTFYVIRVHNNGEAERINVKDNGDGTISFTTDKFSTYALAYTDAQAPKTGDLADYMWVYIMIAICGAVLAGTCAVKRRYY